MNHVIVMHSITLIKKFHIKTIRSNEILIVRKLQSSKCEYFFISCVIWSVKYTDQSRVLRIAKRIFSNYWRPFDR